VARGVTGKMEKQFVPTDRLVVADVVQRYLDASAWLGTARHGTARHGTARQQTSVGMQKHKEIPHPSCWEMGCRLPSTLVRSALLAQIDPSAQ
jgi:hypothetical protein